MNALKKPRKELLDSGLKHDPGEEEVEESKRDWRPRIPYDSIVANLPFVLFLAFLALVYIGNGHYAVKNIRAINKLTTQVKSLQWSYLDIKSELMQESKLSNVAARVAPLGLKLPENPPMRIPAEKAPGNNRH